MATYGFPLFPTGLKPVSRKGSALISPTGIQQHIDPVNSTCIGNNSLVVLSTAAPTAGYITGVANDTPQSPTAVQSLQAYGMFGGTNFTITQIPGDMRQVYWIQQTLVASGKPVFTTIYDDPELEYEIQVNAITGLTQAMVGQYCNLANINWIDGAPRGPGGVDTSGGNKPFSQGQSTTVLNLATLAPNSYGLANNGGRLDVRIIGLSERPNNHFSTAAQPQQYNYALVKLNSFTQ